MTEKSSKIVAIMPVRNEDWCLGLTARALLMWVDELVILDHRSRDRSHQIESSLIREYTGRVTIVRETDPVWEEMRHRQALLEAARARGASHVVTVDADEVLTGNLLPSIRGYVQTTPADRILRLPWIQMRGSLTTYHTNGIWAHQDAPVAFVDSPECHWAQRDGYDFHHRHPLGHPNLSCHPVGPAFLGARRGGLMHLQMVSERRLRAKQALYLMTEVTRWPGRMAVEDLNKMYGPTVYGGSETDPAALALGRAPKDWWLPYSHLLDHIDPDAEPWQEAECWRLWHEHGPETFRGLDLFGVVS